MRSKKALLSFLFSSISQVINIVLSIFVRRLFIEVLGTELLGLNSLYASIVSFLSISELGIGQSIAVCLYKPLAENDFDIVGSYLQFLKKVYYIIGLVIFIVGCIVAPSIHFFTDLEKTANFQAYTFILYTLATAVTYFFSYKKILLTADQKNYIVAASQSLYHIALFLGQIAVIKYTKNYYGYLCVLAIVNLLENIFVSVICNRIYPGLFSNKRKLDEEKKRDLIIKVKGMMSYKLSNYLIQSADNIIISSIIGTVSVALYSNYHLISNLLFSVFSNISSSSTAGMGNILYTDKSNIKFAFSKLLIIQDIVFSITTACFICLSDVFVDLIFGKGLRLSFFTVVLLGYIYDLKGYSYALESIRSSAGLYERDKYLNLFAALINIVVSVVMGVYYGIPGVLVGTIISYVLKELVFVPRIVFREIIDGLGFWYYKNYFMHIFLSCIITCTCFFVNAHLHMDKSLLNWLIVALVDVIIGVIINHIIHMKQSEYKELQHLAIEIMKSKSIINIKK